MLEFLAVRQLRGRAAGRPAPTDEQPVVAPEAEKAGARPTGQAGAGRSRQSRRQDGQGPHPALRRPARRRQDLGRQVHRARDGTEVRPHLAGRRPRRGRHSRPPAHLRGRDAGPDHPGNEAGRHQESGLPARRGGQARRLVPGRPGRGAARGARSGPERLVHRSLPRRAVRPERGAVHRDRELPPEHSRLRCSTGWRWWSSPATPSGRS